MTTHKYDKYITTEPLMKGFDPVHQPKPFVAYPSPGKNLWKELAILIAWECIRTPWLMDPKPMVHDFDQIIAFMGGNIDDPLDLGAEIEFCLGEELEKHIITQTSIVYIPRGMVHAPLNFKRIDKPILYQNIALTKVYGRKLREDDGTWTKYMTMEEESKLRMAAKKSP
ncbi:MAG: hypothetical protein JW967_00015 [Dehalococcoidales bacterium]|nr:hypothetical protein [Dehalococcoidales bacterium]